MGRRDARVEISSSRPNLIAEQDSIGFDALRHVANQRQPSDTKLGDRILGSLGQLHFNWFGGIAIRVAYGALGLTLCVVTSSGINVWLARRRDKGRAAPTLERIWAAIA